MDTSSFVLHGLWKWNFAGGVVVFVVPVAVDFIHILRKYVLRLGRRKSKFEN